MGGGRGEVSLHVVLGLLLRIMGERVRIERDALGDREGPD